MSTECIRLGMSFQRVGVLKDIDLTIQEGDFLAILGPSGCGKTTLLRLLAGFSTPTEGEIKIDGESVANKRFVRDPSERNVSMVFQSYALWPHMTVEQNIAFPIQNSRFVSSEQRARCNDTVRSLVGMVGLSSMEQRLPSQLSGGQRQRVALARALATSPQLLLMDEPLSNLDSELRIEMRQELKRLHRSTGATIVYVTHDQSEALALATRVVVMNRGRIEQIGTPQEIYQTPKTEFVAKFVGRSNLIAGHWNEQGFCPNGSNAVWRPSAVSDELRGAGLIPLKPEQLTLVEDAAHGFSATVEEVEYLGSEMRILLQSPHQNPVELRTPVLSCRVGQKVFVGL